MRHSRNKNRAKILGSLVVLAIVFVVAAIAQFGGVGRPNPFRSEAKTNQPAAVQQERAVFGAPVPVPPAAEPAVDPDQIETDARPEEAKPGTSRKAAPPVNDLLNRWRGTVLTGDLDGQLSLYAPRMEQFFNRRNVGREQVRREKGRMMELYPEVMKYDISDVTVESAEGNRATISFRKEWDMRGTRRFSGAERQRLKLRKMSGVWKIISEEETKVYWVKRG